MNIRSVSTKISVAVFVMGVLALVSIGISLFVFSEVGTKVAAVNDEGIPQVSGATDLILATSGFSEDLTDISLAPDHAALNSP